MKRTMSAADFNYWCEVMVDNTGKPDRELAQLLGVTQATFARYRRDGADHITALACDAVYHRFDGHSWKQYKETINDR